MCTVPPVAATLGSGAPMLSSQSTASALFSAIVTTRSRSLMPWPPFMVSSMNSGTPLSVMSRAAWNFVSAQFMPPEAFRLLPPTKGIFSSTSTFAPSWVARTAAVRPAPPAPTITTSQSSVSAVFSAAAAASGATSKGAVSMPESASARFTASLMALLVTVAPAMASTAMLLAATISPGSFSTATEPMPGVSFCSSTSTA